MQVARITITHLFFHYLLTPLQSWMAKLMLNLSHLIIKHYNTEKLKVKITRNSHSTTIQLWWNHFSICGLRWDEIYFNETLDGLFSPIFFPHGAITMQSKIFFGFFSHLTFWFFLYNISRFHGRGTKLRVLYHLFFVFVLLIHSLYLSFTPTVTFSWEFPLLMPSPLPQYFTFPASARLLKVDSLGPRSCQGAASWAALRQKATRRH